MSRPYEGSPLQTVVDRQLVGACVRIGRDARTGPMWWVTRYDKGRKSFAVRSVFDGRESAISLDEMNAGIADGICHVIGRRVESMD